MSEDLDTGSKTDFQIGQPADEVPTQAPDEECNGKRTDAQGRFRRYCENPAGEGTDHEGRGRCSECGGNNPGPTTEDGKKIARQNTTKHGLTADPRRYHEDLDNPADKEFVLRVSRAVEKRILENTGSVDFLDRVLARRVAVMLHISTVASEHFAEEGLLERIMTPDGQIEVENRMLDHIRQYNEALVRILRDIGATKESEAQMDALAVWRDKLE